jgi:hypothetical protein
VKLKASRARAAIGRRITVGDSGTWAGGTGAGTDVLVSFAPVGGVPLRSLEPLDPLESDKPFDVGEPLPEGVPAIAPW